MNIPASFARENGGGWRLRLTLSKIVIVALITMPKLNRSLVMSIIGDIGEVNRVSEELLRSCRLRDSLEHPSWKFPTKLAKNVNVMEIVNQHEGSAGELYILLLELAYDRIHFVLRLIVDFMHEYPLVEGSSNEGVTNVKGPNYVSLAHVLRLLWNRLKIISEYVSNKVSVRKNASSVEEEYDYPEKASKSVQAGIEAYNCESCGLASDTVLRMINAIEGAFQENKLISAAAEERDLSKGDIYEKTQWAVMRRLVTAIEMDVKTTFEVMRENYVKREAIKRNYEEGLNSLRAELEREGTNFEILRAENAELEARIENVTRRLKELRETNLEMQEVNKKLTTKLEETRKKMERAEESSHILQSQIGRLAENKLELENSVRRLAEEMAGSRDACIETERPLRILLTELQRENHSIKKECRDKVERLEKKLTEMKNCEIGNYLRDTSTERRNVVGLYEETVLMPGDVPEVDMTRQLISNRRKIELLERQNERLSKTLNRLREYRLTSGTTKAARSLAELP